MATRADLNAQASAGKIKPADIGGVVASTRGPEAGELGVPAPLTALSHQMLRAAIAKGYAEDDICGSIRLLEDLARCTVTASQRTTEEANS